MKTIPEDVVIVKESRKPELDSTLGIPIPLELKKTPTNRLVVLGDSLSQGYQSGAIYNTHLSYPAIIANCLGWKEFRYPDFSSPCNGLPLNLEWLIREIQSQFNKVDWHEVPALLSFIRELLDIAEDFWERGEGTKLPSTKTIYHNLAVYSWGIRDIMSKNADWCDRAIKSNPPKDNFLNQFIQNDNERAAQRVLHSARGRRGAALSPVEAAQRLGDIETLIAFIGANNALKSVLNFKLIWSDKDYPYIERNDRYTVWRPSHFKAELQELIFHLEVVDAQHIILGTIPHVTIVPWAKGLGKKIAPGSRYFPYYSFPWLNESTFNSRRHPHLTADDARAIDSAIDQYNEAIASVVRQQRQKGKDWHLFDACGLLDRLASRRYIEDPDARPSWWEEVGGEYRLPEAIAKLQPVPTSAYFNANQQGRFKGGLFSLDGVHPTTIGYGIMAQEIINIMVKSGVKFERENVDFDTLIFLDTLVSNPPHHLDSAFKILGEIDKDFGIFTGLFS